MKKICIKIRDLLTPGYAWFTKGFRRRGGQRLGRPRRLRTGAQARGTWIFAQRRVTTVGERLAQERERRPGPEHHPRCRTAPAGPMTAIAGALAAELLPALDPNGEAACLRGDVGRRQGFI